MQQLPDSGAIDLESIDIPADGCCNCGSEDGLTIVPTPLKKTRFMLLAGTELTFMLGFPYCPNCASTATRLPTGTISKLMVAFGVFWALMLLMIFVVPASMNPGALAIAVLALGLTFGAYALRRPKAPRTSVTQPVTLRGLEQKFSGEVVSLRLGFSYEAYKSRFDEMNQLQIVSGALSTEFVR